VRGDATNADDAPVQRMTAVPARALLRGLFSLSLLLVATFLGAAPLARPPRATASPTLQSGPAFSLVTVPVLTGHSGILFVGNAGDGSGRLFFVYQSGRVTIWQNGAELPTPFIDISSLLGASGGEQGLLGLAFHPNFRQNGKFYLAYSGRVAPSACPAQFPSPMAMDTVAEFTVSRGSPNQADINSRRVVLEIPDFATNHNGGMIAFGPDGYLYVATGDGGGGGDPCHTAQDLGQLLGKLLRIDVDGGLPYAVPPSNPFVGRPGARGEIWDYGFRNPWRFSFDRQTHDLWVADVGQSAREEVDFEPASTPGGRNYGWSVMEGTICYPPSVTTCDQSGKTLPILDYDHSQGCSITGGYVYRGAALGVLRGRYFYGDYCSGSIWSLQPNDSGGWTSALLLSSGFNISSFGEDEAGEVYVANLSGGVYRLSAMPTVGGDANGDGTLSSLDAQCVLRQAAALPATPVCPNPLPFADISRNGVVDATDALCVLRRVAGLPATASCPIP
jgi:glucose/arabinose dehydrogenase